MQPIHFTNLLIDKYYKSRKWLGKQKIKRMEFIKNHTSIRKWVLNSFKLLWACIRKGYVRVCNLFHAGDSKMVDPCHNYLLSRWSVLTYQVHQDCCHSETTSISGYYSRMLSAASLLHFSLCRYVFKILLWVFNILGLLFIDFSHTRSIVFRQ